MLQVVDKVCEEQECHHLYVMLFQHNVVGIIYVASGFPHGVDVSEYLTNQPSYLQHESRQLK